MMHKPVEVHPLAVKETRKAFRWYAQRSQNIAMQFQELVEQARADIESHPQRWPEYLYGTRVMQLRRFPYLIVYRELPTRILLVSVAHGKRRPGYWKRRN